MPINPLCLTVSMVPPLPTLNPPLEIVKIPTELLKTNLEDVAKSSNSLNNTLPLSPGGRTVILTLGGVVLIPGPGVAVIAFPRKFS